MITGAHAVLYSREPEADRAFLRDVLQLPHVDAGHGWLIFGLPPSEIAIHPDQESGRHEIYFLCEDVDAFVAAMAGREIACTPVQEVGWGRLTRLTLPGGGQVGVYQPLYERPPQ
jgi:hypothetical protein